MQRCRIREGLKWLFSEAALACNTWSGSEFELAHQARVRAVDLAIILLVIALPWSTSAASVFAGVVFIFILTTLQIRPLTYCLKLSPGMLPCTLLLLALLGTTWAIDVPWPERLDGGGKYVKLLMVPLLFHNGLHSSRGRWIFLAFVGSNVVLLIYSFFVFAVPHLAFQTRNNYAGIGVKNYIDQSQAFAFIAFALAALAAEALFKSKRILAALYATVSFAFFMNLMFVNIARTAFVYIPAMFLLLLFRHMKLRYVAISVSGLAILGFAVFNVSPNIQRKVSTTIAEFDKFNLDGPAAENSVGERLEFWSKSIRFFEAAPVLGHGTGSIRELFRQDAIGRTGFGALVVSNPHNQTLAVALQWGIIGVAVLWSMWISHLWLFSRSEFAAWLGMLVVVQNVISSMFNSHLSDFYQGWLYVLTVGIAGGQILRSGQALSRMTAMKGESLPSHVADTTQS
jgi:hypothetical protein